MRTVDGIVVAGLVLVVLIGSFAGIAQISARDLVNTSPRIFLLAEVVARTFFGIAVVVANPHLVVSGNVAGTPADAPVGSIVVHIVDDIVVVGLVLVAWIGSFVGIAQISARDLLNTSPCLVLLVVIVARTFFGIAAVVANPHLVASGSAAGTSVVRIVDGIVVGLVAGIGTFAGIAQILARDLLSTSLRILLLVVVVSRTFFGTAVVVANPHLVASGNGAGISADARIGSIVVRTVDGIVVAAGRRVA